jgi:hypothetical protein
MIYVSAEMTSGFLTVIALSMSGPMNSSLVMMEKPTRLNSPSPPSGEEAITLNYFGIGFGANNFLFSSFKDHLDFIALKKLIV